MTRISLAFAGVLAGLAAPLSAQHADTAPAEVQAPSPTIIHAWEKTVPSIASAAWTGARTADGQPNVQGFWSNTIANHNNFEDPQAGSPKEPSKWASLPRDQRAPSRVSDPVDGRVPYLPGAKALQAEFAANAADPGKQKYVEPLNRCSPNGIPKSLYWHGYEIRQFPGHVVFLFGTGTRIIKLDGSAHLHDSVKLWNGDSRGYWDGNTLVVEARNTNGKALFGRNGHFMSENAVVQERYVFAPDGRRFNYIATFDDPTVYARTWTATVPVKRYDERDSFDSWHYELHAANTKDGSLLHESVETACIENNGAFGGGAVGVPTATVVIRR